MENLLEGKRWLHSRWKRKVLVSASNPDKQLDFPTMKPNNQLKPSSCKTWKPKRTDRNRGCGALSPLDLGASLTHRAPQPTTIKSGRGTEWRLGISGDSRSL